MISFQRDSSMKIILLFKHAKKKSRKIVLKKDKESSMLICF
jgi:hypothetical protein